MSKVNLSRILLGGLVAGALIVIGEFVLNAIVLGAQFAAQREAFGLGDPSAGHLIAGLFLTLSYGLVLMWIYAAFRSGFGPGPRTAVLAGLTLWALSHVLFLLSLVANEFATLPFALISIAWGVIEMPIAALAGAWFYRD